MSKRRKLTEDEKNEAREKARMEAEAVRPGYTFTVEVEDWTDDKGRAMVKAFARKISSNLPLPPRILPSGQRLAS
jgi:hypothetical protein